VFTRAAYDGEVVESCGPEAARRARWKQEGDSHPDPIIDDEVPF
jgi:hypothetical protein